MKKKNERQYIAISIKGIDRMEWLRLRKQGLGGSDAGGICRLSPYSNPLSIYVDKISEEVQEEDTEAMRQGRDLEGYVALRFCQETGVKVRRSNHMYRSKEFPWMLADVDRLIVGEDAGLECKTVSPYCADQWSEGKVPPHYLMQCFHYMIVLGKRSWYIAALILGQGFVYRKITWDDEITGNLIKIEAAFWNNHVLCKMPPEADGSDSCSDAIRGLFPIAKRKDVVSLSGFDDKLARRMEVMEQIKRLDTEKTKIDQEIQLFMKDAERAETDGYRVTWGNVMTSSLDTKRLKEEKPEVYQEFLKSGSTRRFQIKAA